MNVLLHMSQTNARSPLCTILCLFRDVALLKVFLHVPHLKSLFLDVGSELLSESEFSG